MRSVISVLALLPVLTLMVVGPASASVAWNLTDATDRDDADSYNSYPGGEPVLSQWWVTDTGDEFYNSSDTKLFGYGGGFDSAYPGDGTFASYLGTELSLSNGQWYDHLSWATSDLYLEASAWDVSNTFGWAEVNGSGALTGNSGVIFDGSSAAGAHWVASSSGVTEDNTPMRWVYWLTSNDGTWYTDPQFNVGTWNPGQDETSLKHAWIYNDPTDLGQSFVIGWEDTQKGHVDWDHQDMIVKAIFNTPGGNPGVPEIPPTLLAGVLPVIALALRRFRK